jgi:leader peptidase (prepilin peptidase) / N-methyltransferase
MTQTSAFSSLALTGVALAVSLLVYAAFAVGSVALAVIDARTKRLPNRIVFPLYGIGLAGFGIVTALLHDSTAVNHLVTALASAAVLFGLFYVLAMFGPMGYGDVKLAGVIGLYLGWPGLPVVVVGMLLGTVSAALFSLIVVATRSARRQTWRHMEVAYGPYLLFGAWVALLLNLLG